MLISDWRSDVCSSDLCINRFLRMTSLALYLFGGAVMWTLMLKSGVHATIAGILLAFAIPISAKQDDERSASHRLEHILHKPVAFIILPIFALANTGIIKIGRASCRERVCQYV